MSRLGACVVLALAAGCSTARPDMLTTRLHPCVLGEGPADAYCGQVSVWENRKAQTGRRLDLKVIVLPGLKATPSTSPLFVLAGGPGQGAAAFVDTWARLLAPVQRDRDIVLVDLRGTGASHPLQCGDGALADTSLTASMEVRRQCLEAYRNYADITQYTTANSMDDLDDVRRYLGYPTVDLYGVSYGSRAALVYLARHPTHVRGVVLDSVLAPANHLPFFLARDAQRAFDLLVRDCGLDPTCRVRFPDLATRFERLLTRLAASPLRAQYRDRGGVQLEVVMTRSRVAGIVLNALYVPELSADIPLLVEQAEGGDFAGLLALQDTMTPLRDSVAMGLQHAVLCAEDVAQAVRLSETSAGRPTFLGSDVEGAAERVCALWPVAEVDADGRSPTDPDVPALVISGELDPVTPPMCVQYLTRNWPHAQRVVIHGSAHNASASECLVNVIAGFLRTNGNVAVNAPCLLTHTRPPFVIDAFGPAVGPEKSR